MNKEFSRWLNCDKIDEASKNRLKEIQNDETAIAERFAIPMSFGTAGLRSTMDVGISKMNVYTVGQTTQGLAELILSADGAERGVSVCYDSRNNSDLLRRPQRVFFVPTALRFIFLTEFAPPPSFLFPYFTTTALQVLTLQHLTTPTNTTDIKYIGKTVRSYPPNTQVSFQKKLPKPIFSMV